MKTEINPELYEYVLQELRRGVAELSLRNTLLSAGHRNEDITNVINAAAASGEFVREPSRVSSVSTGNQSGGVVYAPVDSASPGVFPNSAVATTASIQQAQAVSDRITNATTRAASAILGSSSHSEADEMTRSHRNSHTDQLGAVPGSTNISMSGGRGSVMSPKHFNRF